MVDRVTEVPKNAQDGACGPGMNLVEQAVGCCCGGCGCACCGGGKKADMNVGADALPPMKLSDDAKDKYNERLDKIAKDITDQKSTPLEIPTSLRDTISDMRKNSKSRNEFDGKLFELVGDVNKRLKESGHPEFLELKTDGATTHLQLLRHRGWREFQDSMKTHATHTPIDASQEQLHINDALHKTLNKDGRKVELDHWDDNVSKHVSLELGRAYRELGDTKAYREYLNKLKEESGGKIYYEEDNGTLGLGHRNIRVYHDKPWALDEKLFDRNSFESNK